MMMMIFQPNRLSHSLTGLDFNCMGLLHR